MTTTTFAVWAMLASAVPPMLDVQVPPRQQQQQGRGRAQGELPAAAPGMPIQQLQELFDAFVLVQAQRVLQLSDEDYQRFFPRMKRLQDIRRQQVQQRNRLLQDLRRAYAPLRPGNANNRPEQADVPPADDATLGGMLKRVQDLDAKFEGDLRAARQAIDEVLSVRQRVGFRIFEEDMERQKLDFITRARQGQGPGPGRGGGV